MGRRQRPADSAAVWASTDGARRFYTTRSTRWVIPGIAWFAAVTVLVGPASEFRLYDSWRTGVPLVVAVLAAASVLTAGAIRVGIQVEPGWVTNRRMLWTNRVPAHEIVRFEPPPPYGTLRRTGLRIFLADGRVLSATAFTRGRASSKSLGAAECAELSAWLESQRGARIAPPLH